MKITRLTTFIVPPRWCFLKIETDEGITGWGEVDSAPTVVKAIVDAPLSHQICDGLTHALQ